MYEAGTSEQLVEADLGDFTSSVPDHRNKAGITIKQVVTFFKKWSTIKRSTVKLGVSVLNPMWKLDSSAKLLTQRAPRLHGSREQGQGESLYTHTCQQSGKRRLEGRETQAYGSQVLQA